MMTYTLTPDQQAWLESRVSKGAYSSLNEGVQRLMDQAIADADAIERDDLAWAAHLVAEAQASVARGDVVTLKEHRARNAARRAARTS